MAFCESSGVRKLCDSVPLWGLWPCLMMLEYGLYAYPHPTDKPNPVCPLSGGTEPGAQRKDEERRSAKEREEEGRRTGRQRALRSEVPLHETPRTVAIVSGYE